MATYVDAIHKSSDQINPDQMYVKKKSEYNVKIKSDVSQTCYISGICILPSGETIVADYTNKRVKMLDKHYNVYGDLKVDGNPQDICQILPEQVAITFENRVQFINVIKKGRLPYAIHGISVYETRELPHATLGITYHQGDLYITSGTALYHYDLSGTDLTHKKSLYEDTGSGITGKMCCKYINCIFNIVNTVLTVET
ncbi:hypothetical protein DPMN_184298 [Dreissena polymorpha]|uniref:Uncharacterized protein n=1 Tax=Dreissena polymorpha TaxID=45954 RepID=A0A9D4I692_DREPO|nr:hypothetical protein DPMN_184298 [Dreissena polymorpha]